MTNFVFGNKGAGAVSRRRALEFGVAATSATLMPGLLGPFSLAYADDKPAIGTWPAGYQFKLATRQPSADWLAWGQVDALLRVDDSDRKPFSRLGSPHAR